MAYFFLHFLHVHELAWLLRLLFIAVAYERIESTRIEQVLRAVLFTKDFGGIDNGDNQPPTEMQVYNTLTSLLSVRCGGRGRS